MPMETTEIDLPVISFIDDDSKVKVTDANGTSIIFDADTPHFDLQDELNEIIETISGWLSRVHGHTDWSQFNHPSQQPVRDAYNAQGSIQIRQYVP